MKGLNGIDNRAAWQKKCDELIEDKDNVILSSPTGSGKTQRYELWAINKKERPIFITSPIKSLSNQKFREFLSKGYKVGLETGDIRYMPDDEYDIICCTQEIYNNKYRDLENTTLVIDEFSFIFENEERSRVYIDSLYFSKAKNILVCSATFGNSKAITDYISNLTQRNFYLYENNERLTSLEYKGHISKNHVVNSLVIVYSRNACEKIAQELCDARIVKIRELMKMNSNYLDKINLNYSDNISRNKSKILQFAKKYSIDNESLLELTFMGVVYYHSTLYPKEKLFIEELFENKLIDTVVGTDALALGVNFPIQNVVFTGVYKYTNKGLIRISKNLFNQIAGRAGRKGYYNNGYVYYCYDFSKNYTLVQSKKTLKTSFFDLVKEKESDAEISLKANIKDILNKRTSIENEALFIVKYSTVLKDYEMEKQNITKNIDYIKSYDIAFNCVKRLFSDLNWDLGYESAVKNCSDEIITVINKLSTRLMKLQPQFDKDIGRVYFPEYTPKVNCDIFADVLIGTSLENLINRYGLSFYELVLLKKYIINLPNEYSCKYDISIIDNRINELDYTFLHPYEYNFKNLNLVSKNEEGSKKKSFYECPNYFERVLIKGKEYIKIFKDSKYLVTCDCSGDEFFKLHLFPASIKNQTIGYIKNEERLKILKRIDVGELGSVDEDVVEKIDGAKEYLKKLSNKKKRKK